MEQLGIRGNAVCHFGPKFGFVSQSLNGFEYLDLVFGRLSIQTSSESPI